ncbi:putative surface protease GP63, putative,metallopeptidase [Trypanosoma grayi]|uniref:putative surface protease GP63, putative,metallopeptidase n=1 Tax=Trypanosoma grayi TaxID=71804 RepID=UPI0004F452E8|nr:putative surface protease GP63, putative,metallopeptidase [Trypanosoma grayi]KEG10866.1 putative surface protease GP63, putative,metallopeptidase [Trypanosoma grayi]
MVLYAATGPSSNDTVAAWAMTCASWPDGRPAMAVMKFAPEHIPAKQPFVRIAAHEIAHALGFHDTMFNGRTMLTVVSKLRGKATVTVLTSPLAVEKAKEHYNCTRAIGIELEDEGETGTAVMHFERRNARDELMSPIVSTGYYTALTMAVFEDTGHYRANWGMEEPMSWGRDAGCEFLEEKCVKDGHTKYPDMFCTDENPKLLLCTPDRLSLGVCNVTKYPAPVEAQYRYFNDELKSGPDDWLMDYCPIILRPGEAYWCATGDQNTVPSSRFGVDSMCLRGESLVMDKKPAGDVCAQVRCHNNRTVEVRYAGDDDWHPCAEGNKLKPTKTFTEGFIVCPEYDEVCTIAPDGSSRITKSSRRKARKDEGTGSSKAGDGATDSEKANVADGSDVDVAATQNQGLIATVNAMGLTDADGSEQALSSDGDSTGHPPESTSASAGAGNVHAKQNIDGSVDGGGTGHTEEEEKSGGHASPLIDMSVGQNVSFEDFVVGEIPGGRRGTSDSSTSTVLVLPLLLLFGITSAVMVP